MSKQIKYQIPSLPESEILACLKGLNLNLTKQQLQKPTPEKVMDVYEQFLIHLTQQSGNEITMAKVGPQAECFQHPEIHETSVGKLQFRKQFQKLMNVCHHFDYNEELDLFKPTRKRVVVTLSKLLNFLKFCDSQREQFDAFQEESANRKRELQRASEELAAVASEVNSTKDRLDGEQAERERLKGIIEEDSAAIVELQDRHNELQTRIQTLRSTHQSLKNEVEMAEIDSKEMHRSCETLEHQIVRSPQRIKKVLSTLRESNEEKKVAERKKRQREQALQGRATAYEYIIRKLDSRTEQGTKLLDMFEANKEFDKQVRQNEADHRQLKHDIEDQRRQLQELMAISNHDDSQCLVIDQELKKARQMHRQVVEEQQSNLVKSNANLREKVMAGDSIAKESIQLDEQMTLLKRAQDAQIDEALSKYESFQQRFRSYLEQVISKLEHPATRDKRFLEEFVKIGILNPDLSLKSPFPAAASDSKENDSQSSNIDSRKASPTQMELDLVQR